MLSDCFQLDSKLVRKRRNRVAEEFDRSNALYATLADQTLERLQFCKIEPQRILQIGVPLPTFQSSLSKRYRKADIFTADRALALLQKIKPKPKMFLPNQYRHLCCEVGELAIGTQTIDLILCELELSFSGSLDASLSELFRVLRPGGLLMFSIFGPDTLQELRQSWATVDETIHVHDQLDMHFWGDALIRTGFISPVLDTDRYTFTYKDASGLIADLKCAGVTNSAIGRRKTLTGKHHYAAMVEQYNSLRQQDRVPATIELVFGHAWVPRQKERPQDGSTVAAFPFESLRQSIRKPSK